ncbi:DUF1772 domain-containing protein [Streptomyces sp. NRRL WC-3549]|uniref:anthrone oxygenase family protein n=1 Tax=Streptomyces sp. NRRL WC-3549 TaxID=1463925 RepID=UPI0004CBD804|nr:anthrone oxygenase family protein [Streptomyces sp. NRRL WC-3549]
MSSVLMMAAVLTTGLYAGLLLTFLIAVMPGLAALPDEHFAAAMRRFNESVPGPVFLVLFAGVAGFPAAVLATGTPRWPVVLAGLLCAVAGHLVTVVGNIPLNKALAEAEGGDDTAARAAFESRWNTLHQARTAFSLAAFTLLTLAAL